MSDAKYLIIGNSVAAIAAVSGIREVDPSGSIALVAKEPQHTYSRPLITYLLGGKVDAERMLYRPADWYERSGVNAMLGTEVVSVDPDAHTVTTADDRTLGYEKLLIAVGGTPIVPADVRGTEPKGVFTFTTWEDAEAIREWIDEREVQSAVVIGGGLIGLKSVEALLALGIRTTVVELADRMLSATFDETASRLAQERLRRAGVDVRCATTATDLPAEKGRVVGARLTDGDTVPADLVIFAIGVLPATGIVEGTEIATDRGILVDDRMRTSAPDVYAAGDVAQARALLCGTQRCIAIFPNAYRQGAIAGRNMAGGEASWTGGLVMNAVTVVDLPTISVGMTEAAGDECEEICELDEAACTYRKVVLQGDRIVGAVFVGEIERAGIITGLIRERIDVSSVREMLLTDEFGLISLPSEYRRRVLSGTGSQ